MITVISKKELVPDSYLRHCETEEVREVIKDCASKRHANSIGNKGYSKNKGWLETGAIPAKYYWDKNLRFIFFNPDPVEGDRLRKRFLRENPSFKTTDKRI